MAGIWDHPSLYFLFLEIKRGVSFVLPFLRLREHESCASEKHRAHRSDSDSTQQLRAKRQADRYTGSGCPVKLEGQYTTGIYDSNMIPDLPIFPAEARNLGFHVKLLDF